MAQVDAASEPIGLDAARVTAWFVEHLPDVTPPLHFELITGGRSNLTYRVRDEAGTRWVLRRPPTGELLSSAHDVVREWRILDLLAGGPVPVPPVTGCCTDRSVTGADFYVMKHVEGIVLDDAETVAAIPRPNRPTASRSIVDTLAVIHAVDTTTGPLAQLGKPGSYLERQLRRWSRQLTAGGVGPGPVWDVHELLTRKLPAERWTGLVHGDFRPGNLLIGTDGQVRAVLDWELWTIGDVMADLGWLTATWASADVIGWAPDPADGFLDVDTVASRYADTTGRDLDDLRYHQGFALWKLAAIAEGVAARFRAGAMGDQEVDIDALAQRPAQLAEMARAVLTGRGPG
ncbi:putative phosphotransferase [Rhodococcus aetherivorans]|uniref:Phosphotransferase n=1 Tax=Rhodococcus aetherivorans TaxID=191292 RepID=A0ABQ0YN65_9NOCA|nr:phosphotransferase family protein [Rhodococcus aetherivorans]ETT24591.1 aminoglycoside phosphotransferase [Rhodococcus rhodochrous ATCC 21198]NGP29155.1 phosphotransferase family protein [Rhodococcus aetherivorans]GES37935.1 putative phosphotransferase [Rhodococcus aetherivorans]